jgi:hypothetical protein
MQKSGQHLARSVGSAIYFSDNNLFDSQAGLKAGHQARYPQQLWRPVTSYLYEPCSSSNVVPR